MFDLKTEPTTYEEIVARARYVRAKLGITQAPKPAFIPPIPLEPPPKQPKHPKPPRWGWRKGVVAELPKEVSDLALCPGGWKNTTLVGLLADYRNRDKINAPKVILQMAEDVAQKYEVPVYLVLGKSKVTPVIHARQELCFQLRGILWKGRQPSYPQIARWLGRSDHTVIIMAVRAYKKRHPEPTRLERRERLKAAIQAWDESKWAENP